MPLSFEQFQALRNQGLSVDQIVSFEAGNKPADLSQQLPAEAAPSAKGTFLDKLAGGLDTVFGGGKIGELIGASLAKLGATGLTKEQEKYVNFPTATSVAGDVGQIGLTLGTLGGLGAGGGLAAQVGKNALLGGGFGLASSLKQDQGLSDTEKNVALGAGVGAAIPLIGAGLQKAGEWITQNLPERIVRSALNQPKAELMAGKDVSQYALQNTKLGTVQQMYQNSASEVRSLNSKIDNILSHSDYAKPIVARNDLLNTVMENFPNSVFTPDEILEKVQTIAPKVGKLLAKENLTLAETNIIRKEVGRNLNRAFLRLDNPINQDIGKAFYGVLRDTVQGGAEETIPLFAKEAKEITLRNALRGLDKAKMSRIGLYDILAATGGFAGRGIPGVIGAIAIERGIRNPTVELGGAKLLQLLGKAGPAFTNPATQAAARIGTLRTVTGF